MDNLYNRVSQRRRGEGGFTLIELLVVIAILAILAFIVIFNVTGVTNRVEATGALMGWSGSAALAYASATAGQGGRQHAR